MRLVSLLLLGALMVTSMSGMQRRGTKKSVGDPELEKKIRRFSPTVLTASTAHLSANDRRALRKIIEAAKIMDRLFLRQVWSGNEDLKKKLEADNSVAGRQRLHYFLINKGPWSRIDNKEPFIEGVPHEKPPNANYYPDDMTKDEFNSWVQGLPDNEKQKATGFFWLIRRGADGKLMTVPYSQAYAEFLEPAGKQLRDDASLTINAT